ncbi:CAAX amino terminal protease family protein [[Actinomadura] parvosata subsp. kistnae]|uniref:CAAX protease family protein n=1 Tax=[Actinomadura] parvosata subsp. kistnae TaxID=1909395 RepID=A0A1U9ZVL5_9ACTN|nr:type II CAAX endopeptidase family protein [Nonomuraea sp. ATCC 55076]AQZ62006.1 CAAX protease family protein [Nonomuraea sp. ATCC 55076]SPL99821.1 CAAX amino terminal protease family protein [Actinomadura parvosata subsp. kistnae]
MAVNSPPITEQGRSRTGLRGFIQHRPLISFFVLANLMSWVAWLPYILSQNGLGILSFRFPSLLGTTQFLGVLPGAYLGPIFAAYLVTRVSEGKEGVRRWVRRMTKWRVSWVWYLVTALGVPAVIVVTGLAMTDGQVSVPPVAVLVAYVPGLLLQMVTTGLAEEPGWRDFALARMQRTLGGLGATVVLGPLWSLWHLPLFLTEWGGWPDVTWTRVGEFAAFCCAFSVVVTWVFNRTGQSLPLVMLLHVSVNNFMSIAYSDVFPTLATPALASRVTLLAGTTAAVVVLVATRGRLGYRPPAEPDPQDL